MAKNSARINDCLTYVLWSAMGLNTHGVTYRIMPETIRYRNGPHIPYNSTYIGLPVGSTFTIKDRNNKKNTVTYEVIGKIINLEEPISILPSVDIPTITATDPNKYMDKSKFDKNLTKHLIS